VRFSRLVATTLFAVPLAVFVTGASAQSQNTRDCKYYGICSNQQGFYNSYDNGYRQSASPVASPQSGAPAPTMHEETGIVGPHGVGWY
jgi:hypothetical protein